MEIKKGMRVRLKTREAFENTVGVESDTEYVYRIRGWMNIFVPEMCDNFNKKFTISNIDDSGIRFRNKDFYYPIEIIEEIIE